MQTYFASVVNDAEIGFVLELPWSLELAMSALLLHQFVHKGFISGFWEPALLIQQSQHTRRICLGMPPYNNYRLFALRAFFTFTLTSANACGAKYLQQTRTKNSRTNTIVVKDL